MARLSSGARVEILCSLYSSLIRADTMIWRQRSVSCCRNTAISVGVMPVGVIARSANRLATSGEFTVSAMAWESFVAIADGVFGGATTAYQPTE